MKMFIVRISIAFVCTALSIAMPMRGQTAEFKAGDSVEIMANGKWVQGSVIGRSGCGGTCGNYYVMGPDGEYAIGQGPANIRASTAPPAQQPQAAPSAPANQPTATGILATQAQTPTSNFKVGDVVDAIFNGQFYPARVTGGCGGFGPGCGGYYVIELAGKSQWFVKDMPGNIRAHAMSSTDQSDAAKSAAELAARAKSGNTLAAQYGVREPTTCPNKTAPPTSSAIARLYVMCGMEGFDGIQSFYILSDVNIQVAGSHAFNYARDAADNQANVKAAVYDLRGSFKEYQCTKPQTQGGPYLATHNCILYDQPNATGSCFSDTSGNWHCSLNATVASTGISGQMAPR